MRRADKAKRIQDMLAEYYPETPIPLDHTDPFTLVVAVLLSAQSTDKKVNEITPALFEIAPDAAHLAKTDVPTIKHIIRQIGLSNSKANNLHKLGNQLMERHGGEVPRTFEELEALAGVGHKTASVVMAQAFGHPAFPVDTHIHRLAARWGLSSGKNVKQTEADLKGIFPEDAWNKLHLRFIFFGREHCPALYHDLTACPICSWASTKKRQEEERKTNMARRKRP